MNAEDYKNWAETIALSAAALYFLFKLVSGYLVANLAIGIETKRIPKDDRTDFLLVKLILSKGDRESAVLTQLNVSVGENNEEPVVRPIEAAKIEGRERMIRLAPGESTQFECLFEVAGNSVCRIEVAAKGASGFIPAGIGPETNWKASSVSVPEPKTLQATRETRSPEILQSTACAS